MEKYRIACHANFGGSYLYTLHLGNTLLVSGSWECCRDLFIISIGMYHRYSPASLRKRPRYRRATDMLAGTAYLQERSKREGGKVQ